MTQTFVVVDDHESVLNGTVAVLHKEYPEVRIVTANTIKAAEKNGAIVRICNRRFFE